jgi:hypothetical protein
MMVASFSALERYLRDLPSDKEDAVIDFVQIERLLGEALPPSALQEGDFWGNQKQGTTVETIPWMDAGWMVDKVDLKNKKVYFVRQ